MSMKIIEKEEVTLYNKDVKLKFLNTYQQSTKEVYERIFVKSVDKENEFGKDLYNFNGAEISAVMRDLNPKRYATARTYGRIISAYINWAIEEGLKSDNKNPLTEATHSYFDRFVVDKSIPYYTEDEIRNIVIYAKNPNDAVIVQAIFEGVQGRECSEIRQMRKNDLHGYVLQLRDEEGNINPDRILSVSDEFADIFKRASEQKIYRKKNAEMDFTTNVPTEIELLDNEFVVRNTYNGARNKNVNSAVNRYTIYRRLDTLSELMEQEITVKVISRSGQIAEARRLLKKYGMLDKEQYMKIANKFKVTNWWSIKDYANKETIEEMYGGI